MSDMGEVGSFFPHDQPRIPDLRSKVLTVCQPQVRVAELYQSQTGHSMSRREKSHGGSTAMLSLTPPASPCPIASPIVAAR